MTNSLKIESPEVDEAVDPKIQNSIKEIDDSQRHEKIAERAYGFWEEGGKQDGTADSDWSRAENEYEV